MGDEPGEVVLIWDGAPWHKAKRVQAAASELGFTGVALPSYSPDLNPIEGLWKWMREEVTRNFCHASMRHLFDACKAFIDRINTDPQRLVSRLWQLCTKSRSCTKNRDSAQKVLAGFGGFPGSESRAASLSGVGREPWIGCPGYASVWEFLRLALRLRESTVAQTKAMIDMAPTE